MTQNHPRAGVPHHLSDARPHDRFETVNRTCGARRLPPAKSTAVQPAKRVFEQCLALAAQRRTRAVMGVAVHLDHHRDGFSFSNDPSRWWRRRLIHVYSCRKRQLEPNTTSIRRCERRGLDLGQEITKRIRNRRGVAVQMPPQRRSVLRRFFRLKAGLRTRLRMDQAWPLDSSLPIFTFRRA